MATSAFIEQFSRSVANTGRCPCDTCHNYMRCKDELLACSVFRKFCDPKNFKKRTLSQKPDRENYLALFEEIE